VPKASLVRAFVALWWTAGSLLLLWSLQTAGRALQAGHHNPHLALLGIVEAGSAALFLFGRTMRIGAAGLLATFAVAFGVHATGGGFRGDLILYAAVVSFVAAHGAVPLAWLRPRRG
jgi:uncharacterized membrane protein YphA (DoxX/SURF4 family)